MSEPLSVVALAVAESCTAVASELTMNPVSSAVELTVSTADSTEGDPLCALSLEASSWLGCPTPVSLLGTSSATLSPLFSVVSVSTFAPTSTPFASSLRSGGVEAVVVVAVVVVVVILFAFFETVRRHFVTL